MECLYQAEVVVYINFTDEEFDFIDKAMREHRDTKIYTEPGSWFYGMKVMRKMDSGISEKFTPDKIQYILRALEEQRGKFSMALFHKLSDIFLTIRSKKERLNSDLDQETPDFSW